MNGNKTDVEKEELRKVLGMSTSHNSKHKLHYQIHRFQKSLSERIVLTTFMKYVYVQSPLTPPPAGKTGIFCLNFEFFLFREGEGNRRSTLEVRERTNNKCHH